MSAVIAGLAGAAAMAQPAPQAAQLELSQPFHARSAWRLVVTEGTPVKDYGAGDAPGPLTLCLRKASGGSCLSDAVTPPHWASDPDDLTAWGPHYLLTAKVVYPLGPKAAPLLLIVTGSLNSGDGDQVIATQLLAYDSDRDAFQRIYVGSTGHNNNQETRLISEGPLSGSVITVEPEEHLPFGYWITVNQRDALGAYRQVLRYGSATHYGDGNPLAVIDSEMPAIERRLGLWKPGQPIPTPDLAGGKPCLKPSLRHGELWCG